MDGAAAAGGSGEPTANGEKPQEQRFDPSRMIGIIKRKALIKELAAACNAECVSCGKELLQLQRKWELPAFHNMRCSTSYQSHQNEQYVEAKMPEEPRTLMMKPSKRRKK